MKHCETWKPSKFVYDRGKLVSSRDPAFVSAGSRLMTDLIAASYSTHFKDHCTGRLLDLGCGRVPFFEAYANLVDESVCVDWADSLHACEHLDYECDLTQKLPLPDERFETIILSDVLEHIPNPTNLWQEMSRLLTPGGKVLMNVPFYYSLHEQPHDYYRYTEFALKRFAHVCGFEVIVLRAIGGAPEILADILAKNILRIGTLGTFFALLVQSLCYRLVRLPLGEEISRATAKSFPFGYFLIARKL